MQANNLLEKTKKSRAITETSLAHFLEHVNYNKYIKSISFYIQDNPSIKFINKSSRVFLGIGKGKEKYFPFESLTNIALLHKLTTILF